MQVMLPSAKQRRMKDLDNVTLPLITNGLYNLSGDKSNMYQSMHHNHPHRISRSCKSSVVGKPFPRQLLVLLRYGSLTKSPSHQSSPHHLLIHPPTHARTHARTLSRPSGQGRLLMWSKPTTSGVETPAESNPIGHRLPSPNQTTGDQGVMSTLLVVFFPVN